MTSAPTKPASDVFEVVVKDLGTPTSWLRQMATKVIALVSMGSNEPELAGAIISVQRIDSGEELFRHIEDMDADEDHLVEGLKQDLASMTATEFSDRWLKA